jgi:hypothetical protein
LPAFTQKASKLQVPAFVRVPRLPTLIILSIMPRFYYSPIYALQSTCHTIVKDAVSRHEAQLRVMTKWEEEFTTAIGRCTEVAESPGMTSRVV